MHVVLVDRNDMQHRRRLRRRGFAQVLHVRVDRRIIHAGAKALVATSAAPAASMVVLMCFSSWFGAQRTSGRPVAARCYTFEKKGPAEPLDSAEPSCPRSARIDFTGAGALARLLLLIEHFKLTRSRRARFGETNEQHPPSKVLRLTN